MTFASKLALLAGLASSAAAHGTVTGFTTDGTYNGGFLLDYYYMEQNGETPPETAGWYAENLDNGFVEPNSFNTPDVICHKNAKPATSSATVEAGGTVEFQWSEWPDSHMGPVLTYVAACEGDCAEADKEALQWVKIDEAGLDESGEWAAVAMIANNNTYAATVPETLAAGNYVFRHEIIALHGAGAPNGAQSYPQCVNIEITGSGTDQPEGVLGTELYTAEDPGILFDPYSGDEEYPMPGPPLYGDGSSPGEPIPPVNSTIPVPSGTGAPTGTGVFPTATDIPTEEPSSEPSESESGPSESDATDLPSMTDGPSEPTGAPEFPSFPEIPGGDDSSADSSSGSEPTGLPDFPTDPEFTVSEPNASSEPTEFPEPSGEPGFPEPSGEPGFPEEPELPEPTGEPGFPSEPEEPTDPPTDDGGLFPSLPESFTLETFIEWLKQMAGGSTARRHARDVQY